MLARKQIRQEREVEREKYQNSGYIAAAYNNYYTNAVYSYVSGFWVSEMDEETTVAEGDEAEVVAGEGEGMTQILKR